MASSTRWARARTAGFLFPFLLLLGSTMTTVSTSKAPQMLGVFGDSMVLQHDAPLVHGCGAPVHANIAVLITPGPNSTKNEVVRRVADKIGCFQIPFAARPPMTNASASVSIAVKVSTGNASSPFFARAKNVLYGHQILCGGQSNMVHPLNYDYNASAQIAAATLLPNLRLFQVGRQWSNDDGSTLPLACNSNGTVPPIRGFGCDGDGMKCAAHNVWRNAAFNATMSGPAGTFSAVCYLTVQELMRTNLGTNTAVGLVESDWGGSNEATWQTRTIAVARGCPAQAGQVDSCPLSTKSGLSPAGPTNWGCLFHGMIEPLVRSLRPMLTLWYQGESNANESPNEYQCELESLMAEWRGAFGQSTMPFFVVQLAPYWEPPCEPLLRNAIGLTPPPCGIGTNYPAIRIAQARAVANAEAETGAPSGVCITHDIGDVAGGIHPHNKTEVGRRLALEIRAKVFGVRGLPRITKPIEPARVNSSGLLIQFMSDGRAVSQLGWGGTHNCSECCSPGGTEVVELCDAGCANETLARWHVAPAVWDGSGLRVQIPAGMEPAAVRYAWSNFPQCVLFDVHALPVGPFNLSVTASALMASEFPPKSFQKKISPKR